MRYSVFVGGVEVNDFLLKYHEAVSLASYWKNNGFADVQLVEVN